MQLLQVEFDFQVPSMCEFLILSILEELQISLIEEWLRLPTSNDIPGTVQHGWTTPSDLIESLTFGIKQFSLVLFDLSY